MLCRKAYFIENEGSIYTMIFAQLPGRELYLASLWDGATPDELVQQYKDGVQFGDPAFGEKNCMISIAVNALDEGLIIAQDASRYMRYVEVGSGLRMPFVRKRTCSTWGSSWHKRLAKAQGRNEAAMSAKIHDAETQFLTIAVAKDIGLDQKGLVAQFDALNATRAELGLQPILIYSVVAPAFSRYVRMLVDARRPIPISQFLENAWSKEVNLGMPMSVQAKASLLANDLGFVSWIESLGIAVVPAASINCANAFERASQKLQASIQWNSHRYTAKPVALDAANASLLDHDAFSAFVGGARKSMYQYNYKSWDAREKSFSTRASIANDWNAAAIVEHPRTKLDPELKVRRYERRNSVPGINDVLSLWPKGRTVVLKDLNIRAQDFDLWIQGDVTSIQKVSRDWWRCLTSSSATPPMLTMTCGRWEVAICSSPPHMRVPSPRMTFFPMEEIFGLRLKLSELQASGLHRGFCCSPRGEDPRRSCFSRGDASGETAR